MKLSLIIATYNQSQALAKALQGVAQQVIPPDEVLIADDGSGDDTRRVIEDWQKQTAIPVQHLWHPKQGFRKTVILNRAVAAARGDYLVFTDGDCVPHPRYIADHRALAQKGYWVQERRCYVRQPFVAEFVPGRTPLWSWVLRRRIIPLGKHLRLPVPLVLRNQGQRGIIGCNMAYWRSDVVAINGFDEAYQDRGIGVDSDLGSRLYNLGLRRKFVYGRALVYHLDHPIAPRPHLAENRARLQDTLRTGRTRCAQGLDQYLQVAS